MIDEVARSSVCSKAHAWTRFGRTDQALTLSAFIESLAQWATGEWCRAGAAFAGATPEGIRIGERSTIGGRKESLDPDLDLGRSGAGRLCCADLPALTRVYWARRHAEVSRRGTHGFFTRVIEDGKAGVTLVGELSSGSRSGCGLGGNGSLQVVHRAA